MAEQERINVFGVFFLLFFIFLVFLVVAFICNKFLGVMLNIVPSNNIAYTLPALIFNTIFGVFDKSFLFFAVIVLFGVVIYAYLNPSAANGIIELLLLFALVYVFVFFNTFTYTLNNVFSANTLMPSSYAFFSNHYTLFLFIGIAVLSIIMNFRTKKKKIEENENESDINEE